jgi:hypothetical protein
VEYNSLSKYGCFHHAACYKCYPVDVPDDDAGVTVTESARAAYMILKDFPRLSHVIFDRR